MRSVFYTNYRVLAYLNEKTSLITLKRGYFVCILHVSDDLFRDSEGEKGGMLFRLFQPFIFIA